MRFSSMPIFEIWTWYLPWFKNENFNCDLTIPQITLRWILNKLIVSKLERNFTIWCNFEYTPFWPSKKCGCFYIWPVPLCYQSMHSNLKEKRQILRDTVNHIQTIHKEKGDRRKKNRKGLLTKILNFLHMGKHIHTMPFKIHVSVTSKSR